MTPVRQEAALESASTQPPTAGRHTIWRQLARGSAATAALCASASFTSDSEGAIIYSDTPLVLYGGTWDVDGDGTSDFRLGGFTITTYSGPSGTGFISTSVAYIASAPGGRGFMNNLGPTRDNVSGLPSNLTVGPMPPSGYYWGVRGSRFRSFGGFGFSDDEYAGFRFESNGNTHYGWASMRIFPGGPPAIIDAWAYNDEPDASIQAGQVPEPSSAALAGLGALAAGAAGVRRWRRRRRDDGVRPSSP